MAEIVLFQNQNFGGLHTHFYDSVADLTKVALARLTTGVGGIEHDLGNWNDEVSSFVIISGVWAFFRDVNFGGGQLGAQLGPGLHASLPPGFPNDKLSSIKLVHT